MNILSKLTYLRVQTLAIILLIVATLVVTVVPAQVSASAADDACAAIKLADPNAKCGTDAASRAAAKDATATIVETIINTLSIVVGAVSVIMIIIGGFRYVASGGDSNATKGAKDTIMYAVIGLVVVLFAQVIVAFVYNKATGS